MRLGILNDFDPTQRGGGASRAIQLYLRQIPENIEPVLCGPGAVDRTCDAYLLFLTKRFDEKELGWIQNKPYIWSGFDWWPEEDGNYAWRNIMPEKARLAWFVSPLHYERYTRMYGVQPQRAAILPPPLESDDLRAMAKVAVSKTDLAVWAGEWHVNKGPDLAAVIARRLQIHMDMFSPTIPANIAGQPSVFTPFAHPKGFIPEDDWYNQMAQYKMLIHSPRVPDAFGYVILEAYALGLEVNVSGLTGVESYEKPMDELLDMCQQSPEIFWKAVSNYL